MRKTLVSLLLAGALLPSSTMLWAEDVKIGYVDLQKALNESDAGKQAKEKFKGEVSRLEQSLERRKQEVEKLKEELEKKGLLLKEEERASLESDYRQKMRDFERLYKDSQQELEIKDREMTGRILEDLRQVIHGLGEGGSYTVILEGNNTVVLYGSKAIDLTETVIKSYNAKGPKASAK
jgi:outer membrane protein